MFHRETDRQERKRDKMNVRKKQKGKPGPVLMRVLRYILKGYRWSFLMVIICILGSALATLYGTLFMQSLIDDYILPLTKAAVLDFRPLARVLGGLAAVYTVGILCAYLYNRIMINITQGTMRNLRIQLFSHMESLPVRYFDTHAHGDIMSVYTNDVDTLRQLISQSIPQLINSFITLTATLISMLVLNIPLTVMSLVMAGVMLLAASVIGRRSSRYFRERQRSLGQVNGYIEEMMEGQKVVKVFCHENHCKEQFKKLNEELRKSTCQANSFANIMMPVNGNLGNISYVLCAVLGAMLALGGHAGLTLGGLVSFLNLNKNFTRPITQISQQMNSIVMALAGAERVFELMDETPEEDQGYVELVNARENEDGTLTECRERYSGSCSRSFYVGEEVKQEDIKAKFEDGTLKLLIPKQEEKPAAEEKNYISIEG